MSNNRSGENEMPRRSASNLEHIEWVVLRFLLYLFAVVMIGWSTDGGPQLSLHVVGLIVALAGLAASTRRPT